MEQNQKVGNTAPQPGATRLLDEVRSAIRCRHYSYRTEQAYVHWIERFISFHGGASSARDGGSRGDGVLEQPGRRTRGRGGDEYRPGGEVLAQKDPVEVNERQAALHREAQAAIVGVIRIRSALPVAKQSIRAEGVVIRSLRSGSDRKRRLAQDPRFEDPLRSNEGHALAFEEAALGEQGAREYVPVPPESLTEPGKRSRSYFCVDRGIKHFLTQAPTIPRPRENGLEKPGLFNARRARLSCSPGLASMTAGKRQGAEEVPEREG